MTCGFHFFVDIETKCKVDLKRPRFDRHLRAKAGLGLEMNVQSSIVMTLQSLCNINR